MKLAVALKARKSMRLMLGTLAQKIEAAAYAAEEKPNEILSKFNSVSDALQKLTAEIARINAETTVDTPRHGRLSLTQTKAVRDELVSASAQLASIARIKRSRIVTGGFREDEATGKSVRVADSVQPIQFDAEKAFQQANQAAREARELDALLQSANWTVEINAVEAE